MTVQEKLDEARDALHRLIVGKQAVTITYDGETVTYTAADEARLRRYILELEAQAGLRSLGRARSRAVHF